MDTELFDKDSFAKLTSPEELQERLVIVSFKHWVAAAVIGLLTLLLLIWSIFAQIEVFAQGEGVVLGREIYGFVSFDAGAAIRAGMAVQISIDSANVKKYGYLRGTVKEVFPYLEPLPGHLTRLPLQDVQQYITLQKPYVIFTVDPLKDAATVSGYQWTTKKGPPFPIADGTIATVKVVVDEIRPISYLIPGIQ